MEEKIISGIEFARLMAARKTGVISEDDNHRLERWLLYHAEYRAVYEEFMTRDTEIERIAVSEKKAWDDFCKSNGIRGKNHLALSFRIWLSAACIIAWCVGIGIWYMSERQQTKSPSVVKVEKSDNVRLEMPDGSVVYLNDEKCVSLLAGSAAVDRKKSEIDYRIGRNYREESPEYCTISVPKYAEYSIRLCDGSLVKINSGSRLRYPVHFGKNSREVWLEGEAYFEVAHNSDAHFIVHTRQMDVRVLGTVFNVEARSEADYTKATLLSGSVEVACGMNTERLLPGQQARIERLTDNFYVQQVDTEVVTAWVRGMFYFNRERLEDILAFLSEWYVFQVDFRDEGAKDKKFSVELKRYGDINDILQLIEETGAVEFKQIGRTIQVYQR